jgi:hypothetical protein
MPHRATGTAFALIFTDGILSKREAMAEINRDQIRAKEQDCASVA